MHAHTKLMWLLLSFLNHPPQQCHFLFQLITYQLLHSLLGLWLRVCIHVIVGVCGCTPRHQCGCITELSGYASQHCLERMNTHMKRRALNHTNTHKTPAVCVPCPLWSTLWSQPSASMAVPSIAFFWEGLIAASPLVRGQISAGAQLFRWESRQQISSDSSLSLLPPPCPAEVLFKSTSPPIWRQREVEKVLQRGRKMEQVREIFNMWTQQRKTCPRTCTCDALEYTLCHINGVKDTHNTHQQSKQPTCQTGLVR